MKKIVSLVCMFLAVCVLTGCNNKNLIDFELMAGSMVSKDNMTEEEMMMHDAKVIQYGMYQVKEVLAKNFSVDNTRKIVNIYENVTDSLFYDKSPRDWLYRYYSFFDVYKNVGRIVDGADISSFGMEALRNHWKVLNMEIDDIIEATDKYVGASFAERAKNDEDLSAKLVPILNEINDKNCKIVYRDEDLSHPYIFGTQPEPTRETIIFASETLQKMLNVAPMGEMSTVTLAHVYINDMIRCFDTMLADYDATRYDPTYETMNPWGVTHGRLYGSWADFINLVNKTKALFKEDEDKTTVTAKREKTINIDLELPQDQSADYTVMVYVDGELQSNLTQDLSTDLKVKTFTFKGTNGIKYVKFKINGEAYKIFEIDFDKETAEEVK